MEEEEDSDIPQHMSSPKLKQNTTKQKTDFRILEINFQSLCKKGNLLEAVIDDNDPDIMIGYETWLMTKLKFPKYYHHCQDMK